MIGCCSITNDGVRVGGVYGGWGVVGVSFISIYIYIDI